MGAGRPNTVRSAQRLCAQLVGDCIAWHRSNEQECNREEGNRHYPSHCYHLTTKARPRANTCQLMAQVS